MSHYNMHETLIRSVTIPSSSVRFSVEFVLAAFGGGSPSVIYFMKTRLH